MNLTPSKRISRGAGLALLASALVLTAPAAAHAEDPVELGGAYVLDTVGATSGAQPQLESALDDLYDAARIQLFAVFVDRFTNPSDAAAWADEVAIDNNLGTEDVLLAVAIDDRAYALSVAPDFSLTDDQLDRVELAIEQELRDGDWSGAVTAGAQTMRAEATGVVGPNQPDAPGGESGGTSSFPWGWLLLGAALVVGGILWFRSRARKRGGPAAPVPGQPARVTQEELDRRAGSLLVQLDDSVKSSEQELGFAIAQFGEEATRDFSAVLASAKQKVQQAFEIKQRLDDAQTESEDERRGMTSQIIELCESADAELDTQADAFDQLRQLEQNVPDALTTVRGDIAKAHERRVAAESALAALSATYAPSAIGSVAANVQQAQKLLTFAQAASGKAESELAAERTGEAAIAVRTAQASVGQALQLFDAIDDLSSGLAESSSALEAALADTRADIAAARALPQNDPASPLAPAIAAAEAALHQADSTRGDPVATLALVQQANQSLDGIFEAVRDQQQKMAKASTQLQPTISTARSAIQAAAQFITTRRGGVGDSARTRVSEADRHLTQAIALAPADPIAALAQAQTALQLGENALALARQDVAGYQQQMSYDRSVVNGGGDGADLGGLLGELILGGGGYRGGSSGWSSGPRGGGVTGGGGVFGGGGSSHRSPRSSRSGGFGGSSRTRSSGGRSRGGRF